MSAVHTTDTAAAPPQSAPARRSQLIRWVAGGAAGTTLVAVALAVALAPESATEIARDDGERVGAAVGRLYDAQRPAETDAALAELDAAISDTRVHAGDRVAEQAADQADALARAADGFAGANTTGDAWDAGLYQAELEIALDDLTDQASDFRAAGPETQQAFWEGVRGALPVN